MRTAGRDHPSKPVTLYARSILLFMGAIYFIATLCSRPAGASPLMVGREAPAFSVASGEGNVFSLATKGKKVLVIFYESKDTNERSRGLKDYLDEFNEHQSARIRQSIVWLPVIDCSGVFWPLTAIWKQKMRDHSREEGITIYGDWTGTMMRSYGMRKADNNLVIIDKAGVIRHFTSGDLDRNSFPAISRLLLQLATAP